MTKAERLAALTMPKWIQGCSSTILNSRQPYHIDLSAAEYYDGRQLTQGLLAAHTANNVTSASQPWFSDMYPFTTTLTFRTSGMTMTYGPHGDVLTERPTGSTGEVPR